jgi:hypothetical protein
VARIYEARSLPVKKRKHVRFSMRFSSSQTAFHFFYVKKGGNMYTPGQLLIVVFLSVAKFFHTQLTQN